MQTRSNSSRAGSSAPPDEPVQGDNDDDSDQDHQLQSQIQIQDHDQDEDQDQVPAIQAKQTPVVVVVESGDDLDEWTAVEVPLRLAQRRDEKDLRDRRWESKVYVCTYSACTWSISQKYPERFRAHLRSHTSGRPFKCYDCNLSIPDVPLLNKHLRESCPTWRAAAAAVTVERDDAASKDPIGKRRRAQEDHRQHDGRSIELAPITYHQRKQNDQQQQYLQYQQQQNLRQPQPQLQPRQQAQHQPSNHPQQQQQMQQHQNSPSLPPTAKRSSPTTASEDKARRVRGRQPRNRADVILELDHYEAFLRSEQYVQLKQRSVPLLSPTPSPTAAPRSAPLPSLSLIEPLSFPASRSHDPSSSTASSSSPPVEDLGDYRSEVRSTSFTASLGNYDRIRAADGTTLYCCPHSSCDKMFRRMEHLKRHSKIHSKVKPYQCPYPTCGRFFSRNDNLKQHTRVHAEVMDPFDSSSPALIVSGSTSIRTHATHYVSSHTSGFLPRLSPPPRPNSTSPTSSSRSLLPVPLPHAAASSSSGSSSGFITIPARPRPNTEGSNGPLLPPAMAGSRTEGPPPSIPSLAAMIKLPLPHLHSAPATVPFPHLTSTSLQPLRPLPHLAGDGSNRSINSLTSSQLPHHPHSYPHAHRPIQRHSFSSSSSSSSPQTPLHSTSSRQHSISTSASASPQVRRALRPLPHHSVSAAPASSPTLASLLSSGAEPRLSLRPLPHLAANVTLPPLSSILPAHRPLPHLSMPSSSSSLSPSSLSYRESAGEGLQRRYSGPTLLSATMMSSGTSAAASLIAHSRAVLSGNSSMIPDRGSGAGSASTSGGSRNDDGRTIYSETAGRRPSSGNSSDRFEGTGLPQSVPRMLLERPPKPPHHFEPRED